MIYKFRSAAPGLSHVLNRNNHTWMAIKNHRQKLLLALLFGKTMVQQECIPVGCVPAARWPYAGVCSWGGSVPRGCLLLGGVSALGGLLLGGVCSGGCLLWGGVWSQGVSAPGGCLLRGGLSAPRGVSAPGNCLLGGCLLWEGGVCSGGVYPSMHWGRHPPVDRITDACKTLPWPNFVAAGNYYSWYNLK